jgi:hypothetical protein
MEDPEVKAIYEASFAYDEVRVKADVLERRSNGSWNLIEVKSTTGAAEAQQRLEGSSSSTRSPEKAIPHFLR